MRLGRIRALGCLALASVAAVSSAQYSRIVRKQPQPLEMAHGTVAVFLNPNATQVPLPASYVTTGDDVAIRGPMPGMWYVQMPGKSTEQMVSDFASLPSVDYAAPVFRSTRQRPMILGRRIFLKMQQGLTVDQGVAMMQSLGYGQAKATNLPGIIQIDSYSKNGFDVLKNSNNIALRPDVKFSGPNMTMAGSKQFVPNDPFYPAQWGFKNTGQIATGGSNPVLWQDMRIQPAWDVTLGNPSVGILMLDDGLDLDHPDINRGSAKDFTGENGGGAHLVNFDFHGTLVAGCMTALTNNGIGVAGVAGGCKTFSARVHRAATPFEIPNGFKGGDPAISFYTQEDWLASALLWGLTSGCRVSNNSNYYDFDSELVSDLYLVTRQGGMYHLAATGNEGVTQVPFPASDDSVRAITGIDDQGFQVGTTGAGVDFCMPAVRILTTDRLGNQGLDNTAFTVGEFTNPTVNFGTSYASAYAAGVVALMISVNPNITPPMIDEVLQSTAVDMIEPPEEQDRLFGLDDKWGWGLINAGQAVTNAGFQGVVLNFSSVRGGTNVPGRVILLYPASAGVEARLSSSNPSIGQVPGSISFGVGQTVANFNVITRGVNVPTNVTITATVNDVDRVTSVTVNPPTIASIVVTPGTSTGGTALNALIKTGGQAGPDGCEIQLHSDGAAVRVPPTATILQNRNSINVPLISYKVTVTTTRNITATTPDGKSKTTSVTLLPVTTEVNTLSLNPSSIEGGDTSTGTITLTNPTPVGGINVTITDTSSVVTPPPFVAFAQGETSKTFNITTKEVASTSNVTITARYDVSKKTATLQLKPTLKITEMTATPPSVTGGFSTKVRIVLYSPAPANGVTISLQDFSSAANTPASAFVPPGYKFVDVTIPTIPVNANVNVRVRGTLSNNRFKDVVFVVRKI